MRRRGRKIYRVFYKREKFFPAVITRIKGGNLYGSFGGGISQHLKPRRHLLRHPTRVFEKRVSIYRARCALFAPLASGYESLDGRPNMILRDDRRGEIARRWEYIGARVFRAHFHPGEIDNFIPIQNLMNFYQYSLNHKHHNICRKTKFGKLTLQNRNQHDKNSTPFSPRGECTFAACFENFHF